MKREREKLIVEYVPAKPPTIDRVAVIQFLAGLCGHRFAELLQDVRKARMDRAGFKFEDVSETPEG